MDDRYNATPQTTPSKNRPFVLPGLIEDTPIFRASIELTDEPRSVEVANSSTVVRRERQEVKVTIDDIHEVVVLEY